MVGFLTIIDLYFQFIRAVVWFMTYYSILRQCIL